MIKNNGIHKEVLIRALIGQLYCPAYSPVVPLLGSVYSLVIRYDGQVTTVSVDLATGRVSDVMQLAAERLEGKKGGLEFDPAKHNVYPTKGHHRGIGRALHLPYRALLNTFVLMSIHF